MKKPNAIDKGFSMTREERVMVDRISLLLGNKTMSETIRGLLKSWPKNGTLTEPPAITHKNMMTTSVSVTKSDLNQLNKLSAQYGMRSGRIIRALVHSYYAEHEQEIAAMAEAPAEAEAEAEAEPTATQMPLPEPEQTQASGKTVEAVEMLKDDGSFRLMLLSALGAIADALIESSERRTSALNELNQIGKQLKALNNVAWDR